MPDEQPTYDHAVLRKMIIRTARVELDGEYEGWWFEARTSITVDEIEAMMAENDIPSTKARLDNVIIEWNYVDEYGKPLEKNIRGLGKLTKELLELTLSAYMTKVRGVSPN